MKKKIAITIITAVLCITIFVIYVTSCISANKYVGKAVKEYAESDKHSSSETTVPDTTDRLLISSESFTYKNLTFNVPAGWSEARSDESMSFTSPKSGIMTVSIYDGEIDEAIEEFDSSIRVTENIGANVISDGFFDTSENGYTGKGAIYFTAFNGAMMEDMIYLFPQPDGTYELRLTMINIRKEDDSAEFLSQILKSIEFN